MGLNLIRTYGAGLRLRHVLIWKEASKCLSGSKQQHLGCKKDSIQSKLTGWYAKNLSQGGKDILLKSVVMALPVYAMSCFKLSKGTIHKLTSMMMEFWWNNTKSHNKIHWLSYDKLTLPKAIGGFDFKDLESFKPVTFG